LAIATYDRPYNLKDRRESLSLDQGPAEEIIGAKGLVKAGLMAPTGGSSSEPEEPFVGKQPEFEGLSEKEEAASWELEKLAYKSKLEKLSGIVDDMDEGIEASKPSKREKIKPEVIEKISSLVTRRKNGEKQIQPGKPIANILASQQMTEGYPGRSGGAYQQSFFGEKVKIANDEDHETTTRFEDLEAEYSGSPFNVIPKKQIEDAKKSYKTSIKEIAGSSSEWLRGLKEIITEGEADSYDTISRLHKSKPPKPLTEMTVQEVKTWMEKERSAGAKSTASGQYQINYTNLGYLMDKGVLKPDQIFDADTQDKAYRDLLDKRKFSRFENIMKQGSEVQDPSGVKSLSDKKVKAAMDMQLRLAKEWASIPIPYNLTRQQRGNPSKYPNGLKKGQSYYESNINSVPRSNKGVDFLNYLLSYMQIQEKN
jgi:hypothetical protein